MANAFSNILMSKLQQNVRTLYQRRKHVGKLFLNCEEYLQTFVPKEARELFRDVAPFIATERYSHTWTLETRNGDKFQANIRMGEAWFAPPVPHDLRIQHDAPEEIVERINNWATLGGDVSRDFGRVNKVLSGLNENFSRTAIRYYWPTILAICSEDEETKFLAQELQELRKPVRLTELPVGYAKAMRQTAETIATARLIPADVKPDEAKPGEIMIGIASGQTFKEEIGYVYGM